MTHVTIQFFFIPFFSFTWPPEMDQNSSHRRILIFEFPYQTVWPVNESISREAFENGSLFVAQNLASKKAGLYNFEDILLPRFSA